MSEQSQQQKVSAKGKGLGRGLGSLLGGEEGAFAKSTPSADHALKALSEKLPSRLEPALREGFVEKSPLAAPVVPAHLRLWQIPIEKIEPNPNQPRQIFNKEALQELANSILEKGIIQPLLVRKKGENQFEIIAGERRWRAAQLAGLKDVPAVLKNSEDQEVLELALIENIQRENLNVIEEAEAYDFLIQKYNLTQQELAQKVGKDRATVANVLRLLRLAPKVREMVSSGSLSLGHAKVLLTVAEADRQEDFAAKVQKDLLSVRALERLILKAKESSLATNVDSGSDARSSSAKNLGEELQKLVGSKVILDYSDGKGKIAIHFYSDQELNQIADKLRSAWPT